jgi:bifunctional non-homologous end joining protein LigD
LKGSTIFRVMKPRFVVHEHRARNLHWDLRLELDGVLKSWAVPKIPPTESKFKRLAILVEDHDMDYLAFEGTIEEGYGAGTVEIWDGGEYELKSTKEGEYHLRFHGKRLQGDYKLIHWKERNWLLFKL